MLFHWPATTAEADVAPFGHRKFVHRVADLKRRRNLVENRLRQSALGKSIWSSKPEF